MTDRTRLILIYCTIVAICVTALNGIVREWTPIIQGLLK